MGVICLLGLTIAAVLAFATNTDPVSPAKLYLALLVAYGGAVFWGEHRAAVYGAYLGYILVGAIAASVDRPPRSFAARSLRRPTPLGVQTQRHAFRAIWGLTLLPVASFTYLLIDAGGAKGLMVRLLEGVSAYQGFGYARQPLYMLGPLSVAYFCFGILGSDSRRWRLGFALHLCVSTAISLTTASRGAALLPLVFVAMVYHIAKRRITYKTLIALGSGLVAVVAFLGVIRTNVTIQDGLPTVALSRGSSSQRFIWSDGTYIILPLDLVLEHGVSDPKYGGTFVTAITNAIPRAWWPDKPPSGGVVLTREYLGDKWSGHSNAAPGILAESMMNFGLPVGAAVGYTLELVWLWLGLKYYRHVSMLGRAPMHSARRAILIAGYPTTVFTLGSMTFMEFTNACLYLSTTWGTLALLYLLIRRTSAKRRSLTGCDRLPVRECGSLGAWRDAKGMIRRQA